MVLLPPVPEAPGDVVARVREHLEIVARHPWPWLRRPGSGSLRSCSAWVRTP